MSNSQNRFANLGFSDFRKLARDKSLSKYERIGFPDDYRSGKEEAIFEDILLKLNLLRQQGKLVIDIGPGCTDLPMMMINLCRNNKHSLTFIDSSEMLELLPDEAFIKKVSALYPNCPEINLKLQGKVDVILCYSVLQYILVDTAFFRFLDVSLSLLAPGGQFLIGDIPNISKRNRFFASETGIRAHKAFMNTEEPPNVNFNLIQHDLIDDAIVFALLQRARSQGFDAYVIPQGSNLPMANRREDILITRP